VILKEGGNIFKDPETKQPVTQRINRQDVDTTLAWLEKITNLPHRDFKLGTTGRKDTSGDLDIAVNQNEVTKEDMIKRLIAWVQKNKPDEDPKMWIRKSGISVHFKTPINGDEGNGYVQTDLMFGDPQWMKWSLRGASGDSPYSGAHRQIMMSSIATAQGMKWSANAGLLDRETNELISTIPAEIAKKLLGPTAQLDDLESVETIVTKAKTLPNYDELVQAARDTFAKMNLELPESHELGRIKELAGLNLNSTRML
tara:strand:- start:4979 stop:5746 length:768 start_codon:yes stop_codon:yes gene_type:complete